MCYQDVMSWSCMINRAERTRQRSQDYAFLSLDAGGLVVAWYSGAERIYGYKSEEIVGQHVSCLYFSDDDLRVNPQEELKRTATEGHLGNEGWHKKQDGSRFWANVLTNGSERPEPGAAAALPGWCATSARVTGSTKRY